jgi:hypothetical protein
MGRKELIVHIKDKMKGKAIGEVLRGEILDCVLEIAEDVAARNASIIELQKANTLDKGILADINTYFPLVYKEAKRIFNKPKDTKDVKPS